MGLLFGAWQWLKSKSPRSKERTSESKGQTIKYPSQRASYKFCIAALLLFGLQGFIALAGAFEQIFLDLPSPIPFQAGRAIHLNLSLIWPLLGLIGATYYFFVQETKQNLFSVKLTNWHFWLTLLTSLGILFSLFLQQTDGREYLEATLPFKIGILLSMGLFSVIILGTLFKSNVNKLRPILISIVLGLLTLFFLYLPNLFFYPHPTADEIVKFWVVHLWEEMSFELIGSGLTAALLISIAQINRKTIEKLLYLDLGFIFLTGFFATGHHYYYVGVPGVWLTIGGIFSVLQMLPIIVMVLSTYHIIKTRRIVEMSHAERITMGFLLSSVFHHLIGAGILGVYIAIPQLNLYVHGTLLTSAHAHLALFGVFGFLVLGLTFWILTIHLKPSRKFFIRSYWALLLLNSGLMIMGLALSLAGIVQAYLWRVAGWDFMEVMKLLKPYMAFRALGGVIFTMGDLLLVWSLCTLIWKEREHFLRIPPFIKLIVQKLS